MKQGGRIPSITIVISVIVAILAVGAQGGTLLYGYYSDSTSTPTSALVVIDPTTGVSKLVCDLSSLPQLLGASSSFKYSLSGSGTLFFYTINTLGNISLVQLDPTTCHSNVSLITGLNAGQNDVRDIKYDNVNDKLYMVFPNPFCMHGSLDQVNPATGAVITHLTNVADPVGLDQTAAVSGKSGIYYFVGVPIGAADDITYQLNKVLLSTGNVSTVNLANNNLDIGDMWGSNYTLNVVISNTGVETIVGAVTPSSTTVEECSPSGFYNINTATGNVTCVHGPIEYSVDPMADFDPTTSLLYQIFHDDKGVYYLYSFNAQTNQLVNSVECDVCEKLQVLSALP